MNISQRLRTCAKHTGLDAVIELLQEAADEIDALQARAMLAQQPATGDPVTAVKSIHISQGALKCTNGTQNTLLLQQEAGAVGDTKTPENGFQEPLAQDLSTKAGASQVEPFAHICIVNTKDAGPTKFFTAPSDPRAIPVYTHPAPGVPDAVVRDAERYRWLRDSDHWPAAFVSSQEPEPIRGTDLDSAIDAAMIAAQAQKGGAA